MERNIFVRFDDFWLEKYQRASDKIQTLTGWNNFRVGRCLGYLHYAVLDLVSYLIGGRKISLSEIMYRALINLLGIFFFNLCAWYLERHQPEDSDGSVTVKQTNIITFTLLTMRMFLVPLYLIIYSVYLIKMGVNSWLIIELLSRFVNLSALFFLSCTPRPRCKSNIQEWLEKLSDCRLRQHQPA